MKKLNLKMAVMGILATGAFMLTGCGQQPQPKLNGTKVPAWVFNGGAKIKNSKKHMFLYAVGSAEKSPLGINFQRDEAIANARDALSRQISVKVENMFKTYMSSTGVGDSQTAEKVATDVSKQLSREVLQNSKLINTFIMPDKTMYVLVGMPKIKQALWNATQTTFHNNQALWQEFKAKKAQQQLDFEINKEFN